MSQGPIVHGPNNQLLGISTASLVDPVKLESQYGAVEVPHDYHRSFVSPFVKQTFSTSVGGILELR